MLVSIFQKVTELVSYGIDYFVKVFLSCISLDVDDYIRAFPILDVAYEAFLVLGFAFIVTNAVISILKISFGGDSRKNDSLVSIIVRSLVAFVLLNFGGYLLDKVIHLSTFVYGYFFNLDATLQTSSIMDSFNISAMSSALGETVTGGHIAMATSGFTGAVVLICLVVVLMIGWEMFKLIVEVGERFLLSSLLVYFSPLFYWSLVSNDTVNIFKNWLKMFVTSCLMLSLSTFFLKLVISGLCNIGEGTTYWASLILILAMVRVAQHLDEYLNQLGITTAVTGGNMIDSLLATGRQLGLLGRSGRSNNNRVLGKNKDDEPHSRDGRLGGGLGGVINAVRSGRDAFARGASVKQAASAAGKSFINTMKRTAVGGAVAGAAEGAKKATANKSGAAGVAGAAVKGAAVGAVKGGAAQAAQFVAPGAMNAHRDAVNRAAAAGRANKGFVRGADLTPEARSSINAVKEGQNPPLAAQNYRMFGVYDASGGNALNFTNSGVELCDNARAAGLELVSVNGTDNAGNPQTLHYVTGDSPQMAAFMSHEYSVGPGAMPVESQDDINTTTIDRILNDPAGYGLTGSSANMFVMDSGAMSFDELMNAGYSDAITNAQQDVMAGIEESIACRSEMYNSTMVNTVSNAQPSDCISALFDSTQDLSGNDDLGNALITRSFEMPEVYGFSNISIADAPDYEANEGQYISGGRLLEAFYNGEPVYLADDAYHSVYGADLSPLNAGNGRVLWTNRPDLFTKEEK